MRINKIKSNKAPNKKDYSQNLNQAWVQAISNSIWNSWISWMILSIKYPAPILNSKSKMAKITISERQESRTPSHVKAGFTNRRRKQISWVNYQVRGKNNRRSRITIWNSIISIKFYSMTKTTVNSAKYLKVKAKATSRNSYCRRRTTGFPFQMTQTNLLENEEI